MPKTRRSDSAAAAAAGGGGDDIEPDPKRQRTSSSRSGRNNKRRKRNNDELDDEEILHVVRDAAEVKKREKSEVQEEEEDVDDAGAGGFTLQLANQKQVRVSEEDSQQLQDSCAFFRNAFRHGTMECHNHIISKPDWTLETATAILELIKSGTIPVPTTTTTNADVVGANNSNNITNNKEEKNGCSYSTLKEAADQILLPLRILHPVSGTNIENDTTLVQSIADTWKHATTTFTMDMSTWMSQQQQRPAGRGGGAGGGGRNNNNLEHHIWEDLLFQGTVFVDDEQQQDKEEEKEQDKGEEEEEEKEESESNNNEQDSSNPTTRRRVGSGLQIQLIPENPIDAQPLANGPANILRVGSFGPLAVSVYHTCCRLSDSLRNPRNRPPEINNNKPVCMALPLYCGGKSLLEEQFPDLEFLLIETNTTPTLQMTRITSTPNKLRQVLQAATDLIAPVHLAKLCYLLIPEPSIQMLGKLLTAVQQRQPEEEADDDDDDDDDCRVIMDNPYTLGWDLEKNQFCTLKTLRDTKLILDSLIDSETEIATTGTIKLINVDMTSAPEWSSY